MQILDINADTERAFFTCLHVEEPEDPKFTAHSRSWYAEHKDKGYKAQVLLLDDGSVVRQGLRLRRWDQGVAVTGLPAVPHGQGGLQRSVITH